MSKKHTPKRDWAALAHAVLEMGSKRLGEEVWAILLQVSRMHTQQSGIYIEDDRGIALFALGVFLGAFNMRELPMVMSENAAKRKKVDELACRPTETA